MYIERLTVKNFRNLKNHTFDFSPHINLIIAPNGTGKTNLLEAIAMVSRGKSPRTSFEVDVLPLDPNLDINIDGFTKISAVVKDEKDPKEIILNTQETAIGGSGVKKTYRTKGKNTTQKRFSEIIPSVYFSPESIGYITLGFQKRRELFDSLIEAYDLEYAANISEYKKALRNRNIILKKLQKTGDRDELIYWTKLIINNGVKIIAKRWEMLGEYSGLLSEISKLVLDNKWISLNYLPHIDSTPLDSEDELKEEFLSEVKRLVNTEVAAGKTLKGPHRDKWIINLDDKDLSRFGSRGQQRIGILAIFLAFNEKIKTAGLFKPLLLLDDITSELDKKHMLLLRDTLYESPGQVFLTSTQEEVADLLSEDKQKLNIIRLDQLI